jgi:hypothetical protein
LEAFVGISFGQDHNLFGKRADQAQVDQAIEHFERLVKRIGRYPTTQLSLRRVVPEHLAMCGCEPDARRRQPLNAERTDPLFTPYVFP